MRGRRRPSSLRLDRLALPFLLLSLFVLSGCGFFFRMLGRSVTAPPAAAVAKRAAPQLLNGVRISAIWAGHATVLLQLDDIWIMTDPVFTDSVGMISPRLVEPGISPRELPELSAVVVSHMHFDHLSFGSLDEIERKTRVLLVPPGVKSNMPRYEFEILELATWQRYEAGGLRVTAVPVRHVGGRYGLDQGFEPYAFTGYVFEYHGLAVYFGGDTAYERDAFVATRQRFPQLDLAILPICPIAPRDFMQRTHLDPPEALTAFRDLGARQMLPIHYDTFINSDDYPGDCVGSLRRSMNARGLTTAEVPLLAIGEQRPLFR
jgi:L-ascorbate metabolism protein UlaG (beta-lactamase superfamily)